MNMPRTFLCTVFASLLGTCPSWAGDRGGAFSLAKAIPAESCAYVHSTHNPERDFLKKHWDRVLEALGETGLDQEIKRLLASDLQNEEDRVKFNQRWDRAMELCRSVQWRDLAAHELAGFMRIGSLPQAGILSRPEPTTLDRNMRSVVAFLEELASLSDAVALTSSKYKDAEVWTLGSSDMPFALALFRHRDVVGLATTPNLGNEMIDLLSGESTKSLVATARYRGAMADLPKPEDALSFVDMSRMWSGLRDLVKQSASSDDPQQQKAVAVVNNVFDQFDFVDYIASTEDTTGLKVFKHSVTRLNETARSKKLCRAVVDQKPISGFFDHVPHKATGYFAWSGADYEAAYAFIKDFISQNFDEGPAWIAKWGEMQQQWDFDLQRDLLGHVDGPIISVSLPPAVQTAMAGADWVHLVKVRDGQKTMGSINRQLERFSETITVMPASDIKAEGFNALIHPMLAMAGMGQLSYGVSNDWLYLSNSATAVNDCLATAKGEMPSFVKNERFQAEGILPKGPVMMSAFADTSQWAQQMATQLSMVPMMGAFMPPEQSNEKVRSILMMVGKLAPVVAKMDFTRSSASASSFKGDRWFSESVTTYKPFEPPAAQQPADKDRQKKGSVEGL